MTFFGLTHLGYQDPIGEKTVAAPAGASGSLDVGADVRAGLPPPSLPGQQGPLRATGTRPPAFSSDIHHGSQERYKQMVARAQTPRAPDQLYVTPLTDNQLYGWLMSKSPEPWTQVARFPRKNSEMTKFVKKMSMTNREFSLF